MCRGHRMLGREWLTHCQNGRLHREGDRGRGLKGGAIPQTWKEIVFAVLFSRFWLY